MTSLKARNVALEGRLQPTTIHLSSGSMCALIGPNGSGKTSLLRAFAGVEGRGDVRICGESLTEVAPARRARLLGFVPASRDLVWPIHVGDLLRLGNPQPDQVYLNALVSQLELGEFLGRQATLLSTGERARVLLARALGAKPKLLLLDEPLSNLDPYWMLRILDLLRQCARDATTVLVSLHDLAQLDVFDRAILLDRGRVAADGSPDEVLESSAFTAAFRVEAAEAVWRISPPADPRSSP